MAPKLFTLSDFIEEVVATLPEAGTTYAARCLEVLKAHHLHPTLNVKTIGATPLVLLYNAHRRIGLLEDPIYDECRSVVIDFGAPTASERIVSTLSHGFPAVVGSGQYELLRLDGDVCSEAFDGTCVQVFNHESQWHFVTATCPSIDSSRFFSTTKTHGAMLDEALHVSGWEDRSAFTATLDPTKAYVFALTHHENKPKFGADYSTRFGPSYAVLSHLATRDRCTGADVVDGGGIQGVHVPQVFASPTAAIDALHAGEVSSFVVKRGGRVAYVVRADEVVDVNSRESGCANPWQAMLFVYQQNRPDFLVEDWVRQNLAPKEVARLVGGGEGGPTPSYVIHTAVCFMRDVLHDLYRDTTEYFPDHKRFRMDRDADAALPAMLRFHLAQLRHLQVTYHTHGILTRHAVYHYLCYHVTPKNMRLLIDFFNKNTETLARVGYPMRLRTQASFAALSSGLKTTNPREQAAIQS